VTTGGAASAVAVDAAAEAAARAIAAAVPDPELPFLTIGDLGVVREVTVDDTGVEVALTPTYSGCPATEVIRADVEAALRAGGFRDVRVRTVLTPAWTTDWISDDGRRKLAANGIVPPSPREPGARVVDLELGVPCPRCGSVATRLVSRFGSTPCQAMYRCTSCQEPFDRVKPH
jgi:ring-1,2-phenylacetyl-CoA epoxidase subunit PaaD